MNGDKHKGEAMNEREGRRPKPPNNREREAAEQYIREQAQRLSTEEAMRLARTAFGEVDRARLTLASLSSRFPEIRPALDVLIRAEHDLSIATLALTQRFLDGEQRLAEIVTRQTQRERELLLAGIVRGIAIPVENLEHFLELLTPELRAEFERIIIQIEAQDVLDERGERGEEESPEERP
ncbi:MAG: hypothetical protein Q8R13_01435 [bacterium]|nr:hypothetical protein [bacterium]